MKKLFVFPLLCLAFLACKKKKEVKGDYRDIYTGYYELNGTCNNYDSDSNLTYTYVDYYMRVEKFGNDSSVVLSTLRDNISTHYLTVDIAPDGSFATDSVPGRPRDFKGKFSVSDLVYTSFAGNSLGSSTCSFFGRKKSGL